MSVPRRERSEAVSGTGQSSLSRVAQNALDLCNSDPISLGHLGDRHTVLIHARMRASCERGISPADGEGVIASDARRLGKFPGRLTDNGSRNIRPVHSLGTANPYRPGAMNGSIAA